MDLTISSVLLVALFPLFLAVAILIKLFSPGPVFFKQQRVGYSGRIFMLWKFRTMKPNGDSSAHREYMAKLIKLDPDKEISDAPMVKLDDPRVTRIGKFLRFTYIDELPQLINVFRGEMSLVGPRPPTPYEVAEYTRWHTGRFDAFPGMTGLWQVSGKNRLTFRQMARLDIRYSQQLSWLLDVKILLSTPLVIASQIIKDRKTGKE
jgi:lipopolysaccharide/colanic/teichoic acid biosynthesis glycosyltransferase